MRSAALVAMVLLTGCTKARPELDVTKLWSERVVIRTREIPLRGERFFSSEIQVFATQPVDMAPASVVADPAKAFEVRMMHLLTLDKQDAGAAIGIGYRF